MTETLEALMEKARKVQMTEADMRAQRISFVYGNTHIENNRITREMVADADSRLTRNDRASDESAR